MSEDEWMSIIKLEVQSSPDGFSQPSNRQQGGQSNDDNTTNGKHNGRPGKGRRLGQKKVDKQFNAYTKDAYLSKKVEGSSNGGGGQDTDEKDKDFY